MRHPLTLVVVSVAACLSLLSGLLHPTQAASLPSWLGGSGKPPSVAAPQEPLHPVQPAVAAAVVSDPTLPAWVIAIQQDPALAAKNAAIVDTQRGSITIRFYEQEAPMTVANFKRLADKGFYNVSGMKFHRVVEDFVIQTGDPTGTGFGGSKEPIPLETKNKLLHDTLGIVAMARGPLPDSATSQFYITLGKQSSLDAKYAIFGEVVEGLEVLHQIKADDKVYGVRLTTLDPTAVLQNRKAFAKTLAQQKKLAKRETKKAEALAAKEAKRQQQLAFKRRTQEQQEAQQQAQHQATQQAKQLAQQAKSTGVQASSNAAKPWWKVF